MMRSFLNDLVDFMFPPVCFVCRAALGAPERLPLCQKCRSQITYIESPICERCGRPYAHEPQFKHLCGECMMIPRSYRMARAVAHYCGMLRTTLHLFKYGQQQRLATVLGGLMRERLPSLPMGRRYDLILPVPLHPKRLRDRGFNQALCLSSAISCFLLVPLDRFTLQRVRPTISQVGLSEAERAANVKGAFAVARPEAVRRKLILLIDDIYTSGSTVDECSRVLVQTGAEAVDILTLARVL